MNIHCTAYKTIYVIILRVRRTAIQEEHSSNVIHINASPTSSSQNTQAIHACIYYLLTTYYSCLCLAVKQWLLLAMAAVRVAGIVDLRVFR